MDARSEELIHAGVRHRYLQSTFQHRQTFLNQVFTATMQIVRY